MALAVLGQAYVYRRFKGKVDSDAHAGGYG